MAQAAEAKRGQERRAHQRARLKTSVSFASESNFYTGFTRDISEGGLFVATHNVIPVGGLVDLEFSLPDDGPPIKVKAEVRWAAEYNELSDCPPGLGLSFTDLPEEGRGRIERFVEMRDTLFYDD